MTKFKLFASMLAVALFLIVGSLVYARQAPTQAQEMSPKADAKFACSCSGGGITAGMAVLHCTCGNANCMAVRSTATPGDVAVSCK